MVFILLSEFGSVLRAWIPNGEQKRLRMQKGELLPFLTIFGTAMRAMYSGLVLFLFARFLQEI
jgi:hypothetical protein